MEKTSLPRKEREKQCHRREILNAALKLFSEKSFHDVSMQEIADESEFSVGTLYNFFENKDTLFSELIRDCAKKIKDALAPLLQNDEIETKKLSKYIRAHKQIVNENVRSIKMYLLQCPNSFLTFKLDIDPVADAVRDEIRSMVSDVFKSGISKGLFREISPDIGALLLNAQLESVSLQYVMRPAMTSIDDGILEIEKLFMTGILRND